MNRGTRGRWPVWVVLLAMSCPPAAWSQGRPAGGKLVLFAAADAQQLRMTDADWLHVHRRRGVDSSGPHIVIQSPAIKDTSQGRVIETLTPTKLTVSFEANHAPVDMDSLEVTARKGFFSKSLTAMLRPYVQGTALRVQNVAIPEGNFLIEIAITDRSGSKTVEQYRLQVGGDAQH